MIIDLTDAHWHITPDPDRGIVEVAVVASGRRFAAQLSDADFPAFERLLDELPRHGQVDVGQESARILGRDPFIEVPVDRRPWYRRLRRSA
jgi:hypothetical protein